MIGDPTPFPILFLYVEVGDEVMKGAYFKPKWLN
jgi:hypothetical protein